MGLETGTYIDSLVSTNPLGSDAKSQGDDHLRLIKSTILASFPNITGAMTSTHTELNLLDGATVSTAEINYLDITTLGTGAASKAVVLDGSGNYTWPASGVLTYDTLNDGTTTVTATAAELNYLDITTLGTGVASKAVVPDGSGDYTWPSGGTLTYDTLNDGTTALTSTVAELNILDGATVTVTEVNYLSGVTSALQTQMDAKAPIASPTFTGTPAAPTATAGTSTTQIATTAFVAATAFSSALPGQTGNAGKYLTTDGTNASWADSDARVLLSSATASSDATVDFTTGIDSTYSRYLIEFDHVVPATDGGLFFVRTSTDAGSTFDSTAGDYYVGLIRITSAASTVGGYNSTTATEIRLSTINGASNVSTEGGISGAMMLVSPSDAVTTQMLFRCNQTLISSNAQSVNGVATRQSAEDVNGVRFLFDTGNIASGEFRLYGLR